MNNQGAIEAAVGFLVDAELRGVRQIKGQLSDDHGGHCALGVIPFSVTNRLFNISVDRCFECGATRRGPSVGNSSTVPITGVDQLIVHLNNDHDWSFLDIARKLESLPLGGDAA